MRNLCTMLLVVGVIAPVWAEEVENPTFKSWAAFKVGTTVTLKTLTDANGQKSESVMITKLTELTADKAVVEMTMTTKLAGMEFTTPATKMEHPKSVKVDGKTPAPSAKPEGVVKEGTETVKIGGKEYKTKWYETKVKTEHGEVTGKSWISESVPGSLVKMETKMTGALSGVTTMELVDVKTP